MKRRVLSFVGSMLVAASAAALSPSTDPSQNTARNPDPAERDLGGNAERRLNELNRQAGAGKLELAQLSRDSDAAHARTVSRGRVYVRLAKAGLLAVAGGFEAFVEHAVHLERLRSAIGRDVVLERELSARRVALSRKLLELETRRSTLESEVQAMAQAQTALLSEQDRAEAFARAFSSSVGSAHTAVYGAGVGPGDSSSSSGGFASLKGRLPFPITGRSEIKSAHRPGSEGPGLEMFAPSGSVVRAVHAGRVAFADAYAAYGRTVILDHGGSYYTVSANLASIEVKVGDDVPFGSRIGTVGSGDGANADAAPRLYFEIRVGTNTVAPADWFGI